MNAEPENQNPHIASPGSREESREAPRQVSRLKYTLIYLAVFAVLIFTARWILHRPVLKRDGKGAKIEGDLFLNGAPNGRQSFEMFPPDSERIAEMIENADETKDGKFQGIAAFEIHYADGSISNIEVTDSRIIRGAAPPTVITMPRWKAFGPL